MPEPRTAPARAGGAVAGTLSPLRALLGGLSPAGLQGRLSVLVYHRVLAQPDPLLSRVMDVAAFRERMQWLREYFTVLPLDEAVSALARGTLPARAAAITFDDGYADNATVALPALCELGLTATFFVSSGYLDGGRMWNDTLIEVVRSARGPVLDAITSLQFTIAEHIERILKNEETQTAITSFVERRVDEVLSRRVSGVIDDESFDKLLAFLEERINSALDSETLSNNIRDFVSRRVDDLFNTTTPIGDMFTPDAVALLKEKALEQIAPITHHLTEIAATEVFWPLCRVREVMGGGLAAHQPTSSGHPQEHVTTSPRKRSCCELF